MYTIFTRKLKGKKVKWWKYKLIIKKEKSLKKLNTEMKKNQSAYKKSHQFLKQGRL